MSLYSMARVRRINVLGLDWSEKHARRETKKAQKRVVRNASPVTYVPAGVTTDALAYDELYRGHVEGAFIPKGKGKALHILVKFPESVPVATVADAEAALMLAVDFARSVFGDEAVFAARMDRDEASFTNADLFIAPRYIKKTKHTEKVAISLSRDLKALALQYGPLPEDKTILKRQGEVLQDAFAEFLRHRGYQALRGQKKTTEGPDWTSPEAFGVRTDRAIAEATLEVAKEYYDESTVEHDAAEHVREAVSRGLKVVEDEWGRVADERLETGRAAEDARRKRAEMLEEARELARKIEEGSAVEAKKRVDEADETARRIVADAALEAQSRRQQLEDDEARLKAATENVERDRKRAADLLIDAKAASSAAADEKEQAQQQIEQINRNWIETDQALVAARAEKKRAADACEEVDLTSRQLGLVDRASREEALALVVDDSTRRVRMNEAAMNREERIAYLAPWSAIACSIARAVAEAVRRVRDMLLAARQDADTMRRAAKSRIAADRAELTAERSALNQARTQLNEEKASVAHSADKAREFVEAWKKVPFDQRSPIIRGVFKQAEGIARDEVSNHDARSKGTPASVLLPPAGRGKGR